MGFSDQSEVIDFLSSPSTFGEEDPVEIVETHGAYVFLCGKQALKLKRAVAYDYMDLSTVDLRHKMLVRELDLNAPAAPTIYRDVVPITKTDAGLSLGGDGPVLDWVLRMWRFPAEAELEMIAERGALSDDLATALGEAIQSYHATAPVIDTSGAVLIGDILEELARVFAEFTDAPGTERLGEWQTAARKTWETFRKLLDHRGQTGHVRRAHGDLHLRNLVVIDGRPTLFDALEFDETLGTCDVLYDVAFLIMDLCHRELWQQACRVLDAWLREAHGAEDAGLAALPLFLSVRAAIRAMVLLQTDAAREQPGASAAEISDYIALACDALEERAPMLIAVGGYSASGKSLLAKRLAVQIGALPGAVLLASDLERKAGLSKKQALTDEAYSADQRALVYTRMFERAATLLDAGHAVVLDATFLGTDLRHAAERVASQTGVRFQGIWLDAPVEVLKDRITSRPKGASDATLDVLERQLDMALGDMTWNMADASGTPDEVYVAVCRDLAITIRQGR